MALVCIV